MDTNNQRPQYVGFERDTLQDAARSTRIYYVYALNGKVTLGTVSFRPRWRKYVFAPDSNTVFDSACLYDIATFLAKETQDWRYAASEGRKHNQDI